MSTIIVDKEKCTRCRICSLLCPVGIIEMTDENSYPEIPDKKGNICIKCGHCEVFCPHSALTLNFLLSEKDSLKYQEPDITPEQIAAYVRGRRSIRQFSPDPVDRKIIQDMLDIVRYAPSGGNSQHVHWTVVHTTDGVRKLTGLAVDWMRFLARGDSPLKAVINPDDIIKAWEKGIDLICRNAPHLIICHTPHRIKSAYTDAIIALTYLELTVPAFGLGACWAGLFQVAVASWRPLQEALELPPGHVSAYSMMIGYPKFKPHSIPRRSPAKVFWK